MKGKHIYELEALRASLIDYVKAPYAYSIVAQGIGLSLGRARVPLPLVH